MNRYQLHCLVDEYGNFSQLAFDELELLLSDKWKAIGSPFIYRSRLYQALEKRGNQEDEKPK